MGKLEVGTDLKLRAERAYMKGRVGPELQNGLLAALKTVDVGADVKDVVEKGFTAQTSTAATVNAGEVRYYGMRVTSGTATDPAATAASNAVIVQILDASNGNAVISAVKCLANQDAEVYNVAGSGQVGVLVTNLTVRAVQAADGSSNPAAADRPAITVYYGV